MLLEYIPITKIKSSETYNVYNTDILAYFSFVYDGNVIEYTKKEKKEKDITTKTVQMTMRIILSK